jgi:release factor glutamine methyltransferase
VSTRASVQADLARRLGSAAEARWLVEEVLGRGNVPGGSVSDAAVVTLSAMADRRIAGEPLQYVLGTWAFRTLELIVDPRALIPRPETEQVTERAIVELCRGTVATDAVPDGRPVPRGRPGSRGPVVVDLGTGTGAIALSLAAELAARFGQLEVWATDVDVEALAVAESNRARLGMVQPGAAERVRLRAGSWFEALPGDLAGAVDLVVSNPPYVSEAEWSDLDPEVTAEPRRALVAGAGSDGTPGLAAVEAVTAGALEWLVPGGALVIELAPHQAAPAADLARRLGYHAVCTATDLAGRDRMLVARR